jgi:hypothetical protein
MAVRFVHKQYRFSLVYDFTTTKPTQAVADYTTLKFSDEFNTDAPDPSKWTYDLGTGDGGWGNGEAQTYTNSSDNVIVAGGNLKSLLKVGSGYTSSTIEIRR